MSQAPDSPATSRPAAPGPGPDTASRRSDVVWSLLGRVGTTGANTVLMLALSVGELMDLPTFGLFVAFIGGQLLLSRAVLAGQEQALVRMHGGGERGALALRAGLVVVLGLSALSALAGLSCLLIEPASLPSGWSPWMLMMLGVAAAGTAGLDAACASFLATLRYRRVGVLQLGFASLRAVATLATALWASSSNTAFTVFTVMTALSGGVALVWAVLSTREARSPGALRRAIRLTVLYGRWTAMADAAMVLAIHQGAFLLKKLELDEEAGRYGFALQFALGLFAVYLATYHALLPRATRLGRAHLNEFLRNAYRTAGLAIVGIWVVSAGVMLILPIILERYRPELLGFEPAFLGLAGFVTALLLEAPLGVTCHALFSPRLHLLTMGVRCAAILALGLWWIPEHGETGAGLAQFVGSVLSLLLLVALLRPTLRDAARQAAAAAPATETAPEAEANA